MQASSNTENSAPWRNRPLGRKRSAGPATLLAGVILLSPAVPGTPLAAQVAVPQVVTCPPEVGQEFTGLAGVVRDTIQGVVLPGAEVEAAWQDEDGRRRQMLAQADGDGAYLLCGLPPLTELTVRAAFPSLASDPTRLTIEPGPPAGWDILLGVEEGILVSVLREPGRILGRIVDRDSERPVEAAGIALADTVTGDTQHRLSDGNGRYIFTGLAPGAYRIRVEHLAFEPVDRLLVLPSDRTLQVDVGLTVDPIELEPLVVTAVREKSLEVRGFYQRKEISELLGGGVFATRREIHDAGVTRITHFLGRLPGVRTECSGGANRCMIRMTRGVPSLTDSAEWGCANPNVWVDGTRVLGDGRVAGSIDELVSPGEIVGMEIYRGPSELPSEFGGAFGRCGAIVIWTGPMDALRSSG